MSTSRSGISFCIAVYNEERVLLSQLAYISKGLGNVLKNYDWEILVIENGSTDKTPQLLKKIRDPHIRSFSISQKGHGAAFHDGIERATYDIVVLNAIDLPFGFNDLRQALPLLKQVDIVFGSKAHPRSQVYSSIRRKITSWGYRFLLLLFFHVRIKDTQGTIFMNKKKILPFLPYCDANNAFFTSQIAIYGEFFGLPMKEIPIVLQKADPLRKSKYSVVKDSKEMLLSLLQEYKKRQKIAKNIATRML